MSQEPTPPTAANVTESPVRKPIISAFILFYMSAVMLWVCPPSRTKDALIKPITDSIWWTGVWQGFAVFAPDPRKINFRIVATIKYDDGSEKIWNYPAMEKLGFFERYCKEHFRKFGNDCMNYNELLWPDFARYIARQQDEKAKHPVSITLTRTWADILPIEEGLNKPNPEQNRSYQFFFYKVLPEDLNR
jgi:hypothetical protein